MNYFDFANSAAFLLGEEPTKTKNGRQELAMKVQKKLDAFPNLNGHPVEYQTEGLQFLRERLQEKKVELEKPVEEEG